MTQPSQKSSCFVSQLGVEKKDKLLQGLIDQEFEIKTPQYTHFSAKKKGLSVTFYESGKLVVQGKEMESFIQFYLEPEILEDFSYSYDELTLDLTPRIGVDEAGKGDFFGPLVTTALYSDEAMIKKLHDLGVKDSKKMADKKILELKQKIQKICPHHTIALMPEKYNELYAKFRNLNSLLAWAHVSSIESVSKKTGCKNAHIDQFAKEYVVESMAKKKGLDVQISQSHKGEADIVIAAASIMARGAFVELMDKLSEELGCTLPKGASALVKKQARLCLEKLGKEGLKKICKNHFKTYDEVILETEGP